MNFYPCPKESKKPIAIDADEKQKRAKQYFRLGEQYAEAAKLLLETLISNGNSNAGLGKTIDEALQELERKAPKSDMYLFIPAIFNCIQSTELFIKGLLLLAGEGFERKHGVEDLLDKLKSLYKEDSEVYKELEFFYNSQIKIIGKYKQTNGITNSYDLYMSLRYPEITLRSNKENRDIVVNYYDLSCNGKDGIEQFKSLLENLEKVKLATVKEYNSHCAQPSFQ